MRCFDADPGPELSWAAAPLRFVRSERELRIDGTTRGWEMGYFRGTGGPIDPDLLAEAREHRPAMLAMLGGIGDDIAVARANVEALQATGLVTLFVAGGRDEHELLEQALQSGHAVVDATRMRSIEVAGTALIPVAGGPPRYARSNRACGLGDDDVELWPEHARAQSRVLLSWAAPSPAPGLLGVDAGSSTVAAIARRVGAASSIAAWPEQAPDAANRRMASAARIGWIRFDGAPAAP